MGDLQNTMKFSPKVLLLVATALIGSSACRYTDPSDVSGHPITFPGCDCSRERGVIRLNGASDRTLAKRKAQRERERIKGWTQQALDELHSTGQSCGIATICINLEKSPMGCFSAMHSESNPSFVNKEFWTNGQPRLSSAPPCFQVELTGDYWQVDDPRNTTGGGLNTYLKVKKPYAGVIKLEHFHITRR